MRRYEIEYRLTPDDEEDFGGTVWKRYPVRPDEAEGSATILGLDLGRRYDIRVRLYDEDTKAVSEWVTYPSFLVEADSGAPPAPEQVRLTKGDCLTWEMPGDVLDLRGFRVRHMPCAWDDAATAEPAHEELVDHPPFLLCRVPKGRRSFLVSAVDWDGNESEPTVLIADRGPLDDQAEFSIRARDESALLFPGTVKGASAGFATLTAAPIPGAAGAQPMFGAYTEPWIPLDGAAPMIPFGAEAMFFGAVWLGNGPWLDRRGSAMFHGETQYQWIEYTWELEVHCGEDGPRSVLSADVVVTSVTSGFPMPWRLQYRRKCQVPFIPIDPFEAMIPATGTDEMIPTEPTRPWRPWPGRLLGVQVGVYEFRLLVPGGREQARVSTCSVRISSEAQTLHVLGLTVPANGGTRVPPTVDWRQVSEVRVEPYGAQALRAIPTVDLNRNKGPWIMAFDAAGAQVAQAVEVTVRGY